MSDTPRVDARLFGNPEPVVISVEFARILERESAAKDATIARLREALEICKEYSTSQTAVYEAASKALTE